MADEKFIDVERLIESKNPRILKWMPGFLLRYLKRILHQDEINDFLLRHKEKKNLEFCEAVVEEFNISVEVSHLERIPKTGKVVFVMNHPLGGMDAMILVTALKDSRTDLKFIVNDLLMNLENLKDLFVGVNKHGKNDVSLRDQINNLFESEQAICVFPAGLVSRRNKGKIRDLHWKKTFVTQARRHGQTIIPIYIDGRLSDFFYRLSNFRKLIGVKANLEMLYLSDELFRQRDHVLKFVVGEPVKVSDFGQLNDKAIAEKIREQVYELQKEVNGKDH